MSKPEIVAYPFQLNSTEEIKSFDLSVHTSHPKVQNGKTHKSLSSWAEVNGAWVDARPPPPAHDLSVFKLPHASTLRLIRLLRT